MHDFARRRACAFDVADLGTARDAVISRGVELSRACASNASRQTVEALRLKFDSTIAEFHRLFERRPASLGESYDHAIAVLKAASGARVAAELYGTRRQIATACHDHTRALSRLAVALVLLPDERPDATELALQLASEDAPRSSSEDRTTALSGSRIEDRIIEAGVILTRARRKERREAP